MDELWVGFFKGSEKHRNGLDYKEAVDQMLCFGWTFAVIKSIDEASYAIRFVRRKEKSAWGLKNLKRFGELKKLGLVDRVGLAAFENRDRARSQDRPPEFSAAQLRKFKSHSVAWEFFAR